MSQKWLKQSTAVTVKIGPFIDDTDGKTAETGLSIAQADVRLSKQGGDMAQKNESSSCTHDEIGYYDCALSTTDTNSRGSLVLMVHKTGALPVRHEFVILPANVHDSLVGGSDVLDVQVVGMDANVLTATAIAADAITAAKVAADVTTEIQSGLATAAALTTVGNAVTTLDGVVDALVADIGADGAGLTAIPWNAAWDAEVQSECNDAIVANHLDHLLAVDYDPASKPGVATALLNELIESDGGVSRFTVNALEQAPAGGGGGGTADPDILRQSIATGGTLSTITLDGSASGTNNLYRYNIIALIDGTGAGQSRPITAYDGSTKVATVEPDWEVAPDATTEFVIRPFGVNAATLDDIESAVWDAPKASHQIAGSFGSGVSADVVSISGDNVAADNLEALVDGTGLTLTNVLLPWNPAWVGTELTQIPWNANWDAEVQSEVVDGLTVYTAPTVSYIDGRTLPNTDYAATSQLNNIEADTQDIQGRLPLTLENGRMRVKVEQVVDKVLQVGGAGGFSIGG